MSPEMVMSFPAAYANLDSRGGSPMHDRTSMKLFNGITVPAVVGLSTLFSSALFARIPDSMIHAGRGIQMTPMSM